MQEPQYDNCRTKLKAPKIDLFSPIFFLVFYLATQMIGSSHSDRVLLCFLLHVIGYLVALSVTELIGVSVIQKTILTHPIDINDHTLPVQFPVISVAAVIINTLIIFGMLFSVGFDNIEDFRFMLGEFPGGAYIFLPLQIFSITFSLLVCVKYLNNNANVYHIMLLIMLFASMILTGSRSKVFLLGSAIIMYLYYARVLENAFLILSGAIAAILLTGMRAATIFFGDPGYLKWYVENDVFDPDSFTVTVVNFFHLTVYDIGFRASQIIEKVPETFQFTWGQSLFFEFYSLLPGKQENPAISLNHILFGGSDRDVGYPPTLAAQMYLDFGLGGVLLMSIVFYLVFFILYNNLRTKGGMRNFFIYSVYYTTALLSIYGEFKPFIVIAAYSCILALCTRFIFTKQQQINERLR